MKNLELVEVIDRMIGLGHKSPREIADAIVKLHGEDWLRGAVAESALDIVVEVARQRLGSSRRTLENALKPGDELTTSRIKLVKIWLPSAGWVSLGRCTREQLVEKANWYRALASAAVRRAEWCETIAEMMEEVGAVTVAGLRQTLPPLPASIARELEAA